jgi:FkbM family methyltransferase
MGPGRRSAACLFVVLGIAVASSQQEAGPGPKDDLLERAAAYRHRPHGCTLRMTPAELAMRKFGRLWNSEPHWQEFNRIGGETKTHGYRRMMGARSWAHGGEIVVEIGSHVGSELIHFLRASPPNVTVHTFEPVRSVRVELLQRVRQKVGRTLARQHITLHSHAYGLGSSTRKACFAAFTGRDKPKSAAADETTAVRTGATATPMGGAGEPAGWAGCAPAARAEVRDVAEAFHELGLAKRVDVLQINCEGCECTRAPHTEQPSPLLPAACSMYIKCTPSVGAHTESAHLMRVAALCWLSWVTAVCAALSDCVLPWLCAAGEYEVLARLASDDGALAGVREIEVQFHLDWGTQNDTSKYCAIEDGLRRRGFALAYRHPFLWERWARSVA